MRTSIPLRVSRSKALKRTLRSIWNAPVYWLKTNQNPTRVKTIVTEFGALVALITVCFGFWIATPPDRDNTEYEKGNNHGYQKTFTQPR